MTIYFTYDSDNYFTGTLEAETAPENSTTVEPKLEGGYWSKFGGKVWTNEKIPETASDIIGLSVPAFPASQKDEDKATKHQQILRSIIMRILSGTDDAKAVIADGTLTVVEVTAGDKLNEAKALKLQEVDSAASQYQSYNCKALYITSSLGFKVNADQCSQKNMEVLISLLPDDETTTSFKIYDNTFKDLNRVQLATLKAECEENGLKLYQQRFAYQAKIKACTTIDELNAIEVKFEMMDFSK